MPSSDGPQLPTRLPPGRIVFAPDTTLEACTELYALVTAILWYDHGEAAWREGEMVVSHLLRHGVYCPVN